MKLFRVTQGGAVSYHLDPNFNSAIIHPASHILSLYKISLISVTPKMSDLRSSGLNVLRQEMTNTYNRLQSINWDALFVQRVAESGTLPVIRKLFPFIHAAGSS
jgi:hypothetical protein